MKSKEKPPIELPDHHEERVMQFTKKKGNKKGDYYKREMVNDRKWS